MYVPEVVKTNLQQRKTSQYVTYYWKKKTISNSINLLL